MTFWEAGSKPGGFVAQRELYGGVSCHSCPLVLRVGTVVPEIFWERQLHDAGGSSGGLFDGMRGLEVQ